MDIEKLIAGLSKEAYGSDVEELLLDAATALSALQAELDVMTQRNDENLGMCRIWERRYSELQAENEKLRAELERMKNIMRDNGIMTIPPKYPGGPTEWNIPKPRGRKED